MELKQYAGMKAAWRLIPNISDRAEFVNKLVGRP